MPDVEIVRCRLCEEILTRNSRARWVSAGNGLLACFGTQRYHRPDNEPEIPNMNDRAAVEEWLDR